MGMTVIDLMQLYDTIALCADKDNPDPDSTTRLLDITLDERLDKGLLINNIISECGGMETPWTPYSMYFWKHKMWFETHALDIKKYADTVFAEYDVIDNYHMHDKENRRLGRNEALQRGDKWSESGSEHSSDGGTDTDTDRRTTVDTTEELVSAYNESLYQPSKKTVSTPGGSGDILTKQYGKTTDTNSSNSGQKKEDELRGIDEAEGTDRYSHGNTGIYSMPDLLEKERKLAEGNVYMWIVKRYKKDMVYLIY